MEIDLLAFGPHPDDVEIGAGGILARHAHLGYRCGIVDLTAGEMASNGTVPERRAEAQKAAEILKCSVRVCLELPDAHLAVDTLSINAVIAALRRFRPALVLAPYYRDDRHPDHSTTGELVRRAVYLSGLKRYGDTPFSEECSQSRLPLEPLEGGAFRPQRLFFYLLSVQREPDFIADISDYYEIKEEAIKAHKSQFSHYGPDGDRTLINDPLFFRYIRSRDAYYGSLIGAMWGEGLVAATKNRINDLFVWSGIR